MGGFSCVLIEKF